MNSHTPIVFVLSLLVLAFDASAAIKISDVDIPTTALEGKEATLQCGYDLEGARLKSVRWFLGGKEFYRYERRDDGEQKQAMSVSSGGLTVDVGRSGSDEVVLTDVRASAAGRYRCEVTGAMPASPASSLKVAAERDMGVKKRHISAEEEEEEEEDGGDGNGGAATSHTTAAAAVVAVVAVVNNLS